MSKCELCANGPAGIEGHRDLFASKLDARHMQFRCRICGSIWERAGQASGTLEWRAASGAGQPGMFLPGRE